MQPKFIAIEGLDGAGKSTQIDLLQQFLAHEGKPTRFIHFPRHNDGIFGTLISRFLRGEFGSVDQVHPQLVALLFAEDRMDFAPVIRNWLEEGYYVLVDRYVFSNIAFQVAKLKDEKEKESLRKWILEFEFGYNKLPKPDISLYLDVPFEFTLRALETRAQNDDRPYLGGEADIHEADFSLQWGVKHEYEHLCVTGEGLVPVRCSDDAGGMRTVASIHEEVCRLAGLAGSQPG
jgi:dTMP kinase